MSQPPQHLQGDSTFGKNSSKPSSDCCGVANTKLMSR